MNHNKVENTDQTILNSNELLRTVEWFANYYSVPFSSISIENRLPAGYANQPVESLPDMLSLIGVRTATSKLKIETLDPANLPFACHAKSGSPYVFKAIDQEKKTVTLIGFSDSNPKEVTISFDQATDLLEERYLLVSLQSDVLASRVDDAVNNKLQNNNDWFGNQSKHIGRLGCRFLLQQLALTFWVLPCRFLS